MVPCEDCLSVNYCCIRHREAHKFKHKFVCVQLQQKRAQRAEAYAVHDPPSRAEISNNEVEGSALLPLPGPDQASVLRQGAFATSVRRFPPRTSNAFVSDAEVTNHDEDDYVAELGRAAWKVLHSVADRFPAQPTPAQRQDALQFLRSFAAVYPCEKCKGHFQAVLGRYPPDVTSKSTFVRWMGFFHDQVNITLGKPSRAVATGRAQSAPVR
eukprot:EG_transcript_10939